MFEKCPVNTKSDSQLQYPILTLTLSNECSLLFDNEDIDAELYCTGLFPRHLNNTQCAESVSHRCRADCSPINAEALYTKPIAFLFENLAMTVKVGDNVDKDASEHVSKCTICFSNVPEKRSVSLASCVHRFCESCVYDLVSFVVHEHRPVPVPCPECKTPLDNSLLLKTVEESAIHPLFAEMATESSFERKRYCSNERCGVPFDWVQESAANDSCIACPLCEQLTCAECRAPWHEEWTCDEAKRIRAVTSAVGELARANNWVPCPSCNALVERTEGCNHMLCICGQEFCYDCGGPFDSKFSCDCDKVSDGTQLTSNRIDRAIVSSTISRAASRRYKINLDVAPIRTRAVNGAIHGAIDMSPKVFKHMPPRIRDALLCNECPYPQCSKRFKDHRGLMQHLNTVRSHPVWICCGRVFNCLSEYSRHYRIVSKHHEYNPPKLRKTIAPRPGRRTIRKLDAVELHLQMDEDYSIVRSQDPNAKT